MPRVARRGEAAEPEAAEAVKVPEGPESITPTRVCPVCGAGRMVVIAEFPPTASGGEMVVGVEECAVGGQLVSGREGSAGVRETIVAVGGAESPRAEGEKARVRGLEGRGRRRREGRIREGGSGSGAVGPG